jgi:hypothetical protein
VAKEKPVNKVLYLDILLSLFTLQFGKISKSFMKNKNIFLIALVTVLLLLIPLLATVFSNEVVWGPLDFAVAGILIFGTGLAFNLIFKKVKTIRYKVISSLVLLGLFLFVWAELAVGIFTSFGN